MRRRCSRIRSRIRSCSTAVYAGVCMVTEPTRSAQLAFAVFSALAVLARVQYVVVPLAVLGAELRRGPRERLQVDPPGLARALCPRRPAGASVRDPRDRPRPRRLRQGEPRRPSGLDPALGRPRGDAAHLFQRLGDRPGRACRARGRAVGARAAAPSSRSRLTTVLLARRTDARSGPDRGHGLAALPGALPLHARPTARDRVRPLGEARPVRRASRSACSRPACCCSPHACRSPATRPRTTRTTRRRSGPCCDSSRSLRWATARSPSR